MSMECFCWDMYNISFIKDDFICSFNFKIGFLEFLKTTALGGFFVLLPVLLIYLLLDEALELVVALATPIHRQLS